MNVKFIKRNYGIFMFMCEGLYLNNFEMMDRITEQDGV